MLPCAAVTKLSHTDRPRPGANARGLGGEERLEELRAVLGGDAGTRVLDGDQGAGFVWAGRDGDARAWGDGIEGVERQVQDDLGERITTHADAFVPDARADGNVLLGGLRLHELLHVVDDVGNARDAYHATGRTRVIE